MPWLLFLLLFPVSSFAAEVVLVDGFEGGLGRWQVQSFQGQTDYHIVKEPGGNRVLSAFSQNSASGLLQKIDIAPDRYPYVAWRWRVNSSLQTGDSSRRDRDDYAARVYLVFPHWFKPLSRTINYIWANRLPKGEVSVNPYFERAMMIALRSGQDEAGVWQQEKRNYLEDYRMLFGEEPPKLGYVAIMTDTDNTGETAQAWYDDLMFLGRD